MGWTSIKWDDALRTAAIRGLVKAGGIITRQVVAITPVDKGRLKNSITYATKTFRTNAKNREDGVSTPDDDYTLHIGTNVEYAPYVEYGTRRMKAQSYLRYGFDITRVNAETAFAQEISKELKSRG